MKININEYAKTIIKSLSKVKSSEARKYMLQAVAKTLQGKDVKKNADPELQSAIAEIAAMLDSLQMMASGQAEVEMEDDNKNENETDEERKTREEDEALAKAGHEDETDEEKKAREEEEDEALEKAKKLIKDSAPDGATGSDDAEGRKDDDLPPATEDAIADVAKNALMNTLLMSGMKEIAKAVQELGANQKDQGNAIDNILKDFGFDGKTKPGEEKKPVSKSSGKPVFNTDDSVKFLEGIQKSIEEMNGREIKKEETAIQGSNAIRTNLQPAMKSLLTYIPSNN